LFDVQGNVFTWCQNSYKSYPTGKGEKAAEDEEDNLEVNNSISRVLRGGSFVSLAPFVRSAFRFSFAPTHRVSVFGFRVARTLPLDGFTALPLPPKGVKIENRFILMYTTH
jgi:formylglycine-generating enzyme required for sulfatase activity